MFDNMSDKFIISIDFETLDTFKYTAPINFTITSTEVKNGTFSGTMSVDGITYNVGKPIKRFRILEIEPSDEGLLILNCYRSG